MAGSSHLVDLLGFPVVWELLSPSTGAWEVGGQGLSPLPCGVSFISAVQRSPFPCVSLQVVAQRPKSPADPAAEKPSPLAQAWRLGTGRPPFPLCTRRETATAGLHSPTACGRTGPRPQVGRQGLWAEGPAKLRHQGSACPHTCCMWSMGIGRACSEKGLPAEPWLGGSQEALIRAGGRGWGAVKL